MKDERDAAEESRDSLEIDLALERQDPEEMARLGLSMDEAANTETCRLIEVAQWKERAEKAEAEVDELEGEIIVETDKADATGDDLYRAEKKLHAVEQECDTLKGEVAGFKKVTKCEDCQFFNDCEVDAINGPCAMMLERKIS